jgi:predicted nuclease of predicted toxin-antitoxin system
MKLLLDECVPRPLKRDFQLHETHTVSEAGFTGLKNGALLRAAANAGFEVLITVDQNLIHQQNLTTLAASRDRFNRAAQQI